MVLLIVAMARQHIRALFYQTTMCRYVLATDAAMMITKAAPALYCKKDLVSAIILDGVPWRKAVFKGACVTV